MLLRSSSTPILGSLLSSLSDPTPHRDFDSPANHKHLSDHHHHINKLSFNHHHGIGIGIGVPNFSSYSCNSSSPIPHSIDTESSNTGTGFRRAQSEGNLQSLVPPTDEFHFSSKPPSRSLPRVNNNHSMLHTIPSFSVYNSRNGNEEDDEDEEQEEEEEARDGSLERSVTIGDNIMAIGGGGGGASREFSFGHNINLMIQEQQDEGVECDLGGVDENDSLTQPLFLARGLGIDVSAAAAEGRTTHESNTEDYFKRMVQENPSSSLFLRNYAQFLYQSKSDLRGAEEYYSRAILSDPGDGEILSQYAKIVWELHHDLERASSYFERAVQVAPEDSHVHAAYASFLWETEDEEEAQNIGQHLIEVSLFHTGVMTSATA